MLNDGFQLAGESVPGYSLQVDTESEIVNLSSFMLLNVCYWSIMTSC